MHVNEKKTHSIHCSVTKLSLPDCPVHSGQTRISNDLVEKSPPVYAWKARIYTDIFWTSSKCLPGFQEQKKWIIGLEILILPGFLIQECQDFGPDLDEKFPWIARRIHTEKNPTGSY